MKEIYQKYYQQLIYSGLKFIPNIQIVEDIVGDCFLKFAEHGYPYEVAGKILYASMRHACLDYIRNTNAHNRILNKRIFNEEWIEHEVIEAVVLKQLSVAMRSLPAESRKVIELFYLEEMQCTEIGTLLNKNSNTIRSIKKYALRRLAELIKPI